MASKGRRLVLMLLLLLLLLLRLRLKACWGVSFVASLCGSCCCCCCCCCFAHWSVYTARFVSLLKALREVKIRERLSHPNVVDYKHSWLEVTSSCCLVCCLSLSLAVSLCVCSSLSLRIHRLLCLLVSLPGAVSFLCLCQSIFPFALSLSVSLAVSLSFSVCLYLSLFLSVSLCPYLSPFLVSGVSLVSL